MQNGDGAVIEWAPFRLAPGIDEATLVQRSDELQREFLVQQPGFLRRELLKSADGGWVDLVVWKDAEAANAVMSAAGQSSVCQRYFDIMQGIDAQDPAAGVSHFALVHRWERR